MNLTARNTAIVLDSTADVPDAADRFPNWRVVPLHVRFGDESFRDGVDLSSDAFYDLLRASPTAPATAQPSPGELLECYRSLERYERVLSLHVSARVSGTFASAETAAREAGGDRVRVIDTETASASIAMLALAIQRRLERGTSDEEVEALVERYLRERGLLFTVETLEYLLRGGRIGKARAFAGSLLNVKPILSIRDGEVVPVKRVRGDARALAELVDGLDDATEDGPELRLGLAHAAAPERVAELERLVRARRPAAQLELVVSLGAVIGTHAGPGTVAVFWFRDDS